MERKRAWGFEEGGWVQSGETGGDRFDGNGNRNPSIHSFIHPSIIRFPRLVLNEKGAMGGAMLCDPCILPIPPVPFHSIPMRLLSKQ